MNGRGVVDQDEVRGIFAGAGDAGSAVGFVADGEVELGQTEFLRLPNDRQRLVSGEDDGLARGRQ